MLREVSSIKKALCGREREREREREKFVYFFSTIEPREKLKTRDLFIYNNKL